jgi:phosphoglycolate phosphatase
LKTVDVLIAENMVCLARLNLTRQEQASGMTVKAILTDMDGTITKFNLDYMWMRRAALQMLEEAGLWRPNFSDQMSIYAMLSELRGSIADERLDEIKGRIYKKVQTIESNAAEKAELMPGAKEALNELRQMKKKIVIVTNNGRLGTDRTLERLNLLGIFDAVVTRDDVDELKPNPGMLFKALDLAGAKPDEAILVGDAIIDIKAAKAASVRCVAVPTGPFPATRLMQEEPDFVVGSLLDVPELVHRLDRGT